MAGVAVNDRLLGARVRRLTLKKIEAILLGDDEEFKKAVILKLASSILPRINEVTGKDGKDLIPIPILNGILSDDSDKADSGNEAAC